MYIYMCVYIYVYIDEYKSKVEAKKYDKFKSKS